MALGNPVALGAAVGVLGAANLLNNRFAPQAAVPTSVAVSALLVAIGRRSGCSWADLGLGRAHAVRGLRHGAIAAGGIGALYAAGAALPATRPLFADHRAADTARHLLRQALVDVPLGTVLLEEAGFRSVLPALLRQSYDDRTAQAISAALFGLWHILPSGQLVEANPALAEVSTAGARPSRAKAAAGAVVTTTIGGWLFGALRKHSGSVVAPVLLHTATNSLGYFTAWLVNTGHAATGRPRARSSTG